jgi:1-acyl-sn-glycerol-3-phosphate acyltransferase
MAFDWLPDPEAYEHPRLSWLIEFGFELTIWSLYRAEKLLPRDFRLHAGTLIVSNHQRESDVPILATAICRRAGARILDPLPFFAMREDLLRRDALARLLWTWPRSIARTLALIPLDWLFEAVRARPIRRLREFTLGETLESLCACGLADAQPRAVFNARGLREIAAEQNPLPERVREIELGPAWRTYRGLRRLRADARAKLEPGFHRTIAAHIECFTTLLAARRSLYFAPEGTISPDGHFGRVRAGAWEICRRLSEPPQMLPLALSYDALGPGRLRVVVRAGTPAIPDLRSRRDFDAGLRARILELCVVTPSHLLAKFLHAGPRRFANEDMLDWLQRGSDAARDAGLMLDPLWSRRSLRELVHERLVWLRRKRLVARETDAWRSLWPADAAPGWDAPENIVPYLANSLDDFAPQLSRALRP